MEAVSTGVIFTITLVVARGLVQPETVTDALNAPAPARLILAIDGSSKVELNPLGPLQLYVAPAMVLDSKFNVEN